MQSWSPRRPPAELRTRLFPHAKPTAHSYRRRAELMSWLTPVAACVLTVVAAWGGATRHVVAYDAKDNTTYAAMIPVNGSNAQQQFVLSRSDVNLQWNVWPNAFSSKVTNFSAPPSSLESWNAATTNH